MCGILTINDTYQIEGLPDQSGGIARVRTMRQQLEARQGPMLLLHAGDFLSPSLPSRMFAGEQMVDSLNYLDGDGTKPDPNMFVVFGNHEFDSSKMADAATLQTRINQSQFQWLDTSLVWAKGENGQPTVQSPNLVPSAVRDCNGIKVGIFGITTDVKKAAFVESFHPALDVAREQTAALRKQGAQVVVALSHQAMAEDTALLSSLGDAGPDFVVGGHEHVAQTENVGTRAVYKADADARSAWHITLESGPTGIRRKVELLKLDSNVAPDPALQTVVAGWLKKDDAAVCAQQKQSEGCLGQAVGQSTVTLVAEELQIRRLETNFGNWIADIARSAFPTAQVAFLNSGSLRLNRDIPKGPITRKDVETLFAYPMELQLVQIDGAILQNVINRAIEDWTGHGHWLQISGFAWAHQPSKNLASRLTLLSPFGAQKIGDGDKILAVVPSFLLDAEKGQDGYTMLNASMVVSKEHPDLKALVYTALEAAKTEGISPAKEGRICNLDETLLAGRNPPCLALP